jgi:hypothetical protein
MADKIGHDWRNLESYDADDGSAVDGRLMQFDAVSDAKLYLC